MTAQNASTPLDRYPRPEPADPRRHGLAEDAFALVTGILLVGLGFHLFRLAGLASGGTAGLAFLIHYASGWPLGPVFFAVNLPFYVFAWKALGPAFTLRTFLAVSLLAAATSIIPHVIDIRAVDPTFAALAGGLLIGVGLLVLIRHKSSLGGVGVLAVYLQNRRGWSAGKVQMAVDAGILALALAALDPGEVARSILGAVMLNLVLAVNHKPGRYVGF